MEKVNKITVLYVHANNTDIGGADYCLLKLADELDKTVFRPIVCLSEKTDIVNLYHKAGIKTYIIDMERIKKNSSPFYLIKLILKFIPTILKIMDIIKKEDVDIVHGNDLLDIYGPVAGRVSKKPVLQYIRWILVSPAWLRILLTNLVHLINNKVLTVSNGVARDMFSRQGKVMPKAYTCYDWIDMDKVGHANTNVEIRETYKIPLDATVVGVVGRLDPWKGQDLFVKAASQVLKKHPETVFLIVGGEVAGQGRESFRIKLEQLTVQLGIQENIIFAGHRTDISDVMRSLDIFVHSSVSPDPLPGVVMEAQYCGRPVVGANAGGVPEEIEDGETGLLYEMGNYHDMANKIGELIENKDKAKKMGESGHKRVIHVFDKKKLCKRIENVYVDLLNS